MKRGHYLTRASVKKRTVESRSAPEGPTCIVVFDIDPQVKLKAVRPRSTFSTSDENQPRIDNAGSAPLRTLDIQLSKIYSIKICNNSFNPPFARIF